MLAQFVRISLAAALRLNEALGVGGHLGAYLAVRVERVLILILLLYAVKFRLGEETIVLAVFVVA